MLQKEVLLHRPPIERGLLVQAISRSSAFGRAQHHGLEYIGDSVLAMHVRIMLMQKAPFSEDKRSFSTAESLRHHLIGNRNLAHNADHVGLAHFLPVYAYEAEQLQPPDVGVLCKKPLKPTSTPRVPHKRLADAVEALVGAAYLEGLKSDNGKIELPLLWQKGIRRAAYTLKVLVPLNSWEPLNRLRLSAQNIIREGPQASVISEPHLRSLESLLGHRFEHTDLLVRAITPPTRIPSDGDSDFYHLVGLGTDVLNHILRTHVVACLSKSSLARCNQLCDVCKTDVVLAFVFMCKTTAVTETQNVRQDNLDCKSALGRVKSTTKTALWELVRYDSESIDRLRLMLIAIAYPPNYGLNLQFHGLTLIACGAPHVLQDVCKACLAVVWLDADSSLDDAFHSAHEMLKSFGIMRLIRRLANDDGPAEILYSLLVLILAETWQRSRLNSLRPKPPDRAQRERGLKKCYKLQVLKWRGSSCRHGILC